MKCPVATCINTMGADQVACSIHWFRIPKPLRDRIWREYRRDAGGDAHRAAVFEALEALNHPVGP